MSGQRKSLDDDRGQLFLEFVRVARYVLPKYIVFENVKGILSATGDFRKSTCDSCRNAFMPSIQSLVAATTACPKCGCRSVKTELIQPNKAGLAIRIIANEFESIGYHCSYSVFNCAKLGAPQKRERVILIASRHDQEFIDTSDLLPSEKTSNIKQMGLFITGKTNSYSAKTPPSLRDVLEEIGEHTDLIKSPKACLWLRNVVRPHAEPVTWSLDEPSPTIGSHQGAKLAIAPEGVPEEQVCLQQWHTKGKRLGKGNQLIVPYEFLSDKTLLALQAFPSDWAVCGTRMERAFQIGNAVPSILAEHIGSAIIERINRQDCLIKTKGLDDSALSKLVS